MSGEPQIQMKCRLDILQNYTVHGPHLGGVTTVIKALLLYWDGPVG
jgi:hypothetical protein